MQDIIKVDYIYTCIYVSSPLCACYLAALRLVHGSVNRSFLETVVVVLVNSLSVGMAVKVTMSAKVCLGSRPRMSETLKSRAS